MKNPEEHILKVIKQVQDYMMSHYNWKLNDGDIKLVLEVEHGIRK